MSRHIYQVAHFLFHFIRIYFVIRHSSFVISDYPFPQHCLYFLPLLHGQGSLRPTLGPARTGRAFSTAAAASLTISLPFEAPLVGGAWVAESVPVVVPPNALVA